MGDNVGLFQVQSDVVWCPYITMEMVVMMMMVMMMKRETVMFDEPSQILNPVVYILWNINKFKDENIKSRSIIPMKFLPEGNQQEC